MGLHINKQADLDEMLTKFAKVNPKDKSRSDFMKKEDKQNEEDKKKFFKKNKK